MNNQYFVKTAIIPKRMSLGKLNRQSDCMLLVDKSLIPP